MAATEHGSEWIVDVTDDTFETEVLERSQAVPVVVDFWAEWCGPCRVLGPTLEKLALEADGKFLLAKVDTDRAPRLSQAFGIRSIPSVMAFRDGRPVDGFTGALPEEAVRAFLEKQFPSQADEIVARADALFATAPEEAEPLYREALEKDAGHQSAALGLAELLLSKGDRVEAKTLVDRLMPASEDHRERIEHLYSELALGEVASDANEDDLRKQLEENPDDADVLVELGELLAAKRRFPEALEVLLRAAELDRALAQARIKKLMVDIFHVIGLRSELADEYRTKLARLLY